jgi:hypothetical protein
MWPPDGIDEAPENEQLGAALDAARAALVAERAMRAS